MDGSYTGVVLEIRPGEGFRRAGRRRGSLGLFLGQFASVWREAAFIVCLGFLLLPLTLLTPNLNKVFMDAVFVEGYRHWAWPVVILAALTLVATFALMALRSIAITDTFLRMSIGNTGRFLRHVIRLPAGFFASRLCGELVQRVSYVELAAQFTVQTLMVNFSDCMGILAFGALLFVYDVPLAILSLVSAAVTFTLVGWNLRRDFAMVDQDVTLFSATVRENLTMFDGTIPLADVIRAADDADIGDVIRGRRGGFGAMVKGDEIVVLDCGTVVERGTHDELLAKNGAYAQLVRNEG